MTVINTNLNSLVSQTALNRNNRALGHAMEQLSTGKRINSAADDAAGLAIANKMTAQIRSLNQAVRNANDAVAMIQTAEGATNEITNMLVRMRELAIQSGNDTYSEGDRSALDLEFQQLMEEIDRIGTNTQWNQMNILGEDAGTFSYQVGMGSDADHTITVEFMAVGDLTTDLANLSVAQSTDARDALDPIDGALKNVDDFRANLGAKINRLTYAADNLTNISTNTAASRSRIQDADYAKASSELARTQIIQQAATSVLAQANTSQQTVLKLLQ